MTGRCKEGSDYSVVVTFENPDGTAGFPETVEYQIYCVTSGTLVRDWTEVTPGVEVTITATAEDNVIQNDRNTREKKQMVVRSTTPDGIRTTEDTFWIVDNLRGVR